jgi:hypothetical protein
MDVSQPRLGASSDEELLESVSDGDRDPLSEPYDRHVAWPVLRLGRRCSDLPIVDAVIRDALLVDPHALPIGVAWKEAT